MDRKLHMKQRLLHAEKVKEHIYPFSSIQSLVHNYLLCAMELVLICSLISKETLLPLAISSFPIP